MPKTESFEKYSDAYDEWFKKNFDLYEAELEAIRQLIPPPGSEGMEVGVGSGKFAAPLGIKIGVEPSEKMAIKARLRAKGKNELEIVSTHMRWLSRKNYTSEQRCKKLRKENDQTLVKLSNDINIPQWDLRTYFEDE